MFEFISLTRHSHTHAAQAQDGRKEEGAEHSASHGVIEPPIGGLGNLEGGIGVLRGIGELPTGA